MDDEGRVIRIEVHVTRSRLIALGVLTAILAGSAAVMSAETQVSSTLPAPSGVFRRLITTFDTTLARGGGTVKIGVDAAGNAALEVRDGVVYVNTLVLKPLNADPAAPVQGQLWYRTPTTP